MGELGKLERVRNIRQAWQGEASHFTPWLAQQDNLSLLAETLGFGAEGFELEAVEFSVGAFRADILARDMTSPDGDRILIENQFGKTDHDHLGKLITYASGLKARTVILIGEEIREEHRSALDWLNGISDDHHQFFAVSVELWRIGDSKLAPRFNVVVKPNNWERLVNSTTTLITDGLSELRQLYIRYWAAFGEHVRARNGSLQPRKPFPQQWTGFGIGRTGCELNAFINTTDRWIRAELTLGGKEGKAYFTSLKSERPEIDAALSFPVEWEDQEGKLQSRVSVTLPDTNPTQESDWARQHDWLATRLAALEKVFRPRLAQISYSGPKLI
jgi:hypothetical protein